MDNCQVGVFAALCRGDLASLIDAHLYLPKDWTEDAARCRKAAIPQAAQRHRSKTDLALAMLETAGARGVRFGYLAVDGSYGKEPAFFARRRSLGLPLRGGCPL